jgi:hypothetical protein
MIKSPLITRLMQEEFMSDEAFNGHLDRITEGFAGFKSDPESPEMNKIIGIAPYADDNGKTEVFTIILGITGDHWDDWEKRKIYLEVAGAQLRKDKKDIVAGFLISEIWVSNEDIKTGVRSGRREALMIIGQTVDGRNNFSLGVVKKDRTLEPFQTQYYGEGLEIPTIENRILDAFLMGYMLQVAKEKRDKS